MPINNDLERRVADVFEVFDHANNKTVDVREIATIVRALGCCPTEAEVQEIILAIENPESPGNIHLASFLPYACQMITEHKYVLACKKKNYRTECCKKSVTSVSSVKYQLCHCVM